MSGFDYFKDVLFNNYANFEGRARRSEYWYFVLFVTLISLPFTLIPYVAPDFLGGMVTIMSYGITLIVFLPRLGVAIRRLHDTNRSGWSILFVLIPLVGFIMLIVFYATEGDRGDNKYGPDPKGGEAESIIQDNLV